VRSKIRAHRGARVAGGETEPYLPPVPLYMPEAGWSEWLARMARNINTLISRPVGTTGGGGGGVSVITDDVAPAGTDGNLWWDSNDGPGGGQLYVFYDDPSADAGSWVSATNMPGPMGPAGPTGAAGPPGTGSVSGMVAGQIPIAATATGIASSANLSGDITSAPTTLATTLATVNANVGTFQGLTVNGKGLVTAAANQSYLTANQTITASGDATGSGTITLPLTLATVNSNIGTWNNVTINAKGLATAGSNVAYLTGNQNITITGDGDGSGTTAIALTLDTVNANVGTFQGITVNGKGLVTAAANQSYLTANQTITLAGDLSGSGTTTITAALTANSVITSDITNSAVTLAKLENRAAATLLGNPTAGVAAPSEITLGANLSFVGSALTAAGGGSTGLSGMTAGQIPIAATATTITSSGNLSGAVTTSNSLATTLAANAVATTNILASNVTYAKIQNVAASRLLGNPTGSVAAPSEISLGTGLTFAGTVLNAAFLVTIADAAPTLTHGLLWFDSVSAKLYIGLNDGTSTQWVPVA
jgi:hypothetical protein